MARDEWSARRTLENRDNQELRNVRWRSGCVALEEEDMSLTLAGKLSRNVYVLRGTHKRGTKGWGGGRGQRTSLPFCRWDPQCLISVASEPSGYRRLWRESAEGNHLLRKTVYCCRREVQGSMAVLNLLPKLKREEEMNTSVGLNNGKSSEVCWKTADFTFQRMFASYPKQSNQTIKFGIDFMHSFIFYFLNLFIQCFCDQSPAIIDIWKERFTSKYQPPLKKL